MKRILPLLFILVGCKENTTQMQRLPQPSDYDTTLVNQPGKVVDTMRPIMNIIFAHDTVFIHDTIYRNKEYHINHNRNISVTIGHDSNAPINQ